MDSNKIAKKLVALRGEKSRESVAVALGLSLSTLTMYEIGARIPRDENKEKIARYYGKTVDEIFLLNFVTYRDIKKERTVKASTKNLLMAAVGIPQSKLEKMSELFHCSIDYLLEREPDCESIRR